MIRTLILTVFILFSLKALGQNQQQAKTFTQPQFRAAIKESYEENKKIYDYVGGLTVRPLPDTLDNEYHYDWVLSEQFAYNDTIVYGVATREITEDYCDPEYTCYVYYIYLASASMRPDGEAVQMTLNGVDVYYWDYTREQWLLIQDYYNFNLVLGVIDGAAEPVFAINLLSIDPDLHIKVKWKKQTAKY